MDIYTVSLHLVASSCYNALYVVQSIIYLTICLFVKTYIQFDNYLPQWRIAVMEKLFTINGREHSQNPLNRNILNFSYSMRWYNNDLPKMCNICVEGAAHSPVNNDTTPKTLLAFKNNIWEQLWDPGSHQEGFKLFEQL